MFPGLWKSQGWVSCRRDIASLCRLMSVLPSALGPSADPDPGAPPCSLSSFCLVTLLHQQQVQDQPDPRLRFPLLCGRPPCPSSSPGVPTRASHPPLGDKVDVIMGCTRVQSSDCRNCDLTCRRRPLAAATGRTWPLNVREGSVHMRNRMCKCA